MSFDEEKILPPYTVYLFNPDLGGKYFEVVPEGGTTNMIKVSPDYMKEFLVPYLGEIETQRQIVEKLDRQMQALEGVRLLKSKAQKLVEDILTSVGRICKSRS